MSFLKYEDAVECLQKIIDLLDCVEKQHCELYDLSIRYNREQMDLLHEIEFMEEAHVGEAAQKLKQLRMERRVVKDEMDLFFPLKEFCKAHKEIKPLLAGALDELRKKKEGQLQKVYNARSGESSVNGVHYDQHGPEILPGSPKEQA